MNPQLAEKQADEPLSIGQSESMNLKFFKGAKRLQEIMSVKKKKGKEDDDEEDGS